MLAWQVTELIGQVDSVLTTMYWIALIVGGGLLLISTFAGGDADVDVDTDLDLDFDGDVGLDTGLDAHVDTDVDMNVDVDAGHAHVGDAHAGHAHGGSLATWFSTQFVVFFLAMFGAVGVVMTHLSEQSWTITLLLALVGGFVIGQGAHQVMRAIKRTSGDSTPGERDYVNKLARVTIAINGNGLGQIIMRVGRSDRYVAAKAKRAEDSFAKDEEVGVIAYGNGVAEVVSRREYEFIHEGRETSAE